MSAVASPPPKLQFFDDDGTPLIGGKIYTYSAGSTVPLATYRDRGLFTRNTNPIILDARGEAIVALDDAIYDFLVADVDGNEIDSIEDIENIAETFAQDPLAFTTDDGEPLAGGRLYTYISGTTTPLVTYTDDTGNTQNDNPIILDANGEAAVFLAPATYCKYMLKDALDGLIYTVEGVTPGIGDGEEITEHDYWTFWNNFRLLASTGTADTGPSGRVPTYNGGMGVSAAQSKFGGSSFLFDGTDDFISFPDAQFYELSSLPFVIEFWIRPSDLTGTRVLFGKRTDSSTYSPILLQLSGATMQLYASSSGSAWAVSNTNIGTLTVNVWQHVRLQRSLIGANLAVYVNGTLSGFSSLSAATALVNNTATWRFGADSNGNRFVGNMDDISFTMAEWVTGDFTTPTAPSLDHQPTITPSAVPTGYGSPPAFTNVGQGDDSDVVDGYTTYIYPNENSYATVNSTVTLSGDWTFESWVIHDGLAKSRVAGSNVLFNMVRSGIVFTLLMNTTKDFAANCKVDWQYDPPATTRSVSVGTIARKALYHVAVCYVASSANVKVFFNGTLIDNRTITTMNTGAWSLSIAGTNGSTGSTSGFSGFAGPWQFTNGTAKYSGNFTP